jgi:hypothetical protein
MDNSGTGYNNHSRKLFLLIIYYLLLDFSTNTIDGNAAEVGKVHENSINP